MRLLLAFAVTCSFLAGQTCGNGMRVFHPPVTVEGEIMSRMTVRCDLDRETGVSTDASEDCGPGQCIAQGKIEPDPALSIAAEIANVPSSVGLAHSLGTDDRYVAFAEPIIDALRPSTVVRRE